MRKLVVVGIVLALGVTASMAMASGKPGSQDRGAGKVQLGDKRNYFQSAISRSTPGLTALVSLAVRCMWTGGVSFDSNPIRLPVAHGRDEH